MKRSTEIKKMIENLIEKIEGLRAENKIKEAHAELDTLNELKEELAVALAIEEEQTSSANVAPEDTSIENVNPNAVFNKLVFNRRLTEPERRYAEINPMQVLNAPGTPGQVEHTPEKGGYLVPEEQLTTLHEFRRKRVQLKDLCTVVQVTTFKGRFPTVLDENGELIAFEELNEINQSDIDFAQLSWEVKDYGDIIPLSNTFLDDVTQNMMTFIGGRFSKKAVNTENTKILALLNTLSATNIADYHGITTALNKTLDPAISASAKILTNQTAFDYMDKLTDKNDRPLLSDSLTEAGKKQFKGKTIEVIPDAILKNTGTKAPLFVGDFEEFMYFFDRKGVEVSVSEHAGFTKNATLMRAIERFDVIKVDGEAVVKLMLETVPTP